MKETVVLISSDLRTRSYLRAQLLEEGVQVSTFNSVGDARHWLYIGGRVPALIIVDVWRNPLPSQPLEWLKDISDRSPVVFLAGARGGASADLESMGEVLKRPISIADVVSRIRSRIGRSS